MAGFDPAADRPLLGGSRDMTLSQVLAEHEARSFAKAGRRAPERPSAADTRRKLASEVFLLVQDLRRVEGTRT
jgi:hypothetical protein